MERRRGGEGRGGGRQVGWSVAAADWCALSYVGINHDSEMTYFLTPQTNSTFSRSQGLCQTAFSPRSLPEKKQERKKELHLVELDYRDIIQEMLDFISGTICLCTVISEASG